MNRQIAILFSLFAVLFSVLIVFTSRWTVLEAESLEDEPANRRALIKEQKIPRGVIYARDGRTVLARSDPEGSGQSRIFTRTYPTGPLFSHAVGYSFIENGRRGLEQERNDDLAGEEDEFMSIISELESSSREGFDVVTNLDAEATEIARDGLGGRKGGVVAVEPKTGKVRVMVSVPEYDANQIPGGFRELNTNPDKPLLNRTTQELYPPGSTFKVVTAAAALDSGKFSPTSIVDGSSPKTISGAPLENAGGQSFGPVSLTDGLTNSVNTVWATVGESIGRQTLIDYMDRFGFNEDPKIDYPDFQMIPSGVIDADGRYLGGGAGFDVGRVAIGQGGAEGQIRASPLQMALVAAAIGNRGRLMMPRLTDRIVRKDGRVKDRVEPDLQSEVMKPESAKQLTDMMGRVVEEGTGTAAALSGVAMAGKTGTAEVGANRELTQPWFIGFAPIDNPQVAVAVTVESQPPGSSGGQTAGPIAKAVVESLLRSR
ncbi:MAG TPA: penicillin-binding transpeptidase domain-containing protein [Thermoleophilaceae bacterium]|nr:penicillin-binding transpeptidase domain-containing protein [Thermoleophilaceae bacterium]